MRGGSEIQVNANRVTEVSEEVPTDRKLILLWTIILVVSVLVMVSLVGATYESTDWGTWRNAVISLGLSTLCVTVTWALVRQANLKRRHSRTPDWKIIGEFTIFIWLYAVGVNLMSLWVFADFTPQDNRVFSAISPMIKLLSVAVAPALWWFPIWTFPT